MAGARRSRRVARISARGRRQFSRVLGVGPFRADTVQLRVVGRRVTRIRQPGHCRHTALAITPLREGTHMPHRITQRYDLPPSRGDILAFTPSKAGTRFIDTSPKTVIHPSTNRPGVR